MKFMVYVLTAAPSTSFKEFDDHNQAISSLQKIFDNAGHTPALYMITNVKLSDEHLLKMRKEHVDAYNKSQETLH
jgi:hypothetical protein